MKILVFFNNLNIYLLIICSPIKTDTNNGIPDKKRLIKYGIFLPILSTIKYVTIYAKSSTNADIVNVRYGFKP
jgi:hypothetical protein